MDIHKAYQVRVVAYHKQIVPKHTKNFESEEKALAYKDVLSKEVIWNTSVSVDIVPIFFVKDEKRLFMLNGEFVNIEN